MDRSVALYRQRIGYGIAAAHLFRSQPYSGSGNGPDVHSVDADAVGRIAADGHIRVDDGGTAGQDVPRIYRITGDELHTFVLVIVRQYGCYLLDY